MCFVWISYVLVMYVLLILLFGYCVSLLVFVDLIISCLMQVLALCARVAVRAGLEVREESLSGVPDHGVLLLARRPGP